MIAFGLIPATALLFSQHRALQLEVWPLLRETSFYLVGLSLFLKVIADSVTETIEAFLMTSVYFLYVGTVVGVHLFKVRNLNVDKEKMTPLEIKEEIELSRRNVRKEGNSEVSELTKNLFPEDTAESDSLLLKPSLSIEDLELQISDDSTSGAFWSSPVPNRNLHQNSSSSQVKVDDLWNTVASPVRTVLLYVIPTLHKEHILSSEMSRGTLGSNCTSSSPASEFIEQIVVPSNATPGGESAENISDSEFFAEDDDEEVGTKSSKEMTKKKRLRMIYFYVSI
jgi:Ca2+/Na+ antiporter